MSAISILGGSFNPNELSAAVTIKDNFNITKEKREEHIAANSGVINAYFCGFTAFSPENSEAVYMPIEKLRLYVMYDLLVKVLRNSGHKVNHVMNITDIATSPWQGMQDSHLMEEEFFSLFSALSLEAPDTVCRASEHIPDMIALLDGLTEKGYTYVYDNNLYFATGKFRSEDTPLPIAVKDTSGKHNAEDFVLWFGNSQKYPNPPEDRLYPSPKGIKGKGFPGWHIECSVMALKYCGEYLSIHGGSSEHKSAHHASEVLQSEAFIGHKWVDNWFHIASLKFADGKREGVSLERITDNGYTADDLKYFFLRGNYSQRLTFSWKNLRAAAEEYVEIKDDIAKWQASSRPVTPNDLKIFSRKLEEFDSALRNDLNTQKALSIFKELSKENISPECKLIFASHVEKTIGLNLVKERKEEAPLNIMAHYLTPKKVKS